MWGRGGELTRGGEERGRRRREVGGWGEAAARVVVCEDNAQVRNGRDDVGLGF